MKKGVDKSGRHISRVIGETPAKDYEHIYISQKIRGINAKGDKLAKEFQAFERVYLELRKDSRYSTKDLWRIIADEVDFKLTRTKFFEFVKLLTPKAIAERKRFRLFADRISRQNEKVFRILGDEPTERKKLLSFVVGKKDKNGVYPGFPKGDWKKYMAKEGKKISKGVAKGSREGGKSTKGKFI